MTHVAVLGAGVIGITTAWYLRQAGLEVTVIERESSAAMQTSFANGGQISVSHATPWANPSTPLKALKWLFKEDAPLLFRLKADKTQLQWALKFLQQCNAKCADANLVQMVRLGLYSRQALQDLRQSINIQYEQQTCGIMHFYTSKKEFEAAIEPTARMQALGCERRLIDIETAVSLEPALYSIAAKLKGATYTSEDESGNAHLFTQRLAQRCQQAGVRFLYNTPILALNKNRTSQANIHSVTIHPKDNHLQTFVADLYVLALGSYSGLLTKPLGIDLPVFPAKGYSATYQINPCMPHFAPSVSLIDDEFKLVTSRLGDKLRVAGTAEFNGYNLSLNKTRCEALTHRTQQLFSQGLMKNSVEYWSGLRPMTPSNVPLIGRAYLGRVKHGIQTHKNNEACFDNLWLNTGHGTLGWTHACGSAKALTQLIQGEKPNVDFDFIR